MTKDDIIKLAREAGFMPTVLNHWPNELERFANLVAARAREACAKFIEHDYVRQFERPWRDDLSAAIRAATLLEKSWAEYAEANGYGDIEIPGSKT